MLEVLTEAEETADGQSRVARILDEQRRTLRFAMSRPQVSNILKGVAIKTGFMFF